MAFGYRMAAILVLVILLSDFARACDVDDVAVYKVSLHMLWSEERFPKDYPQNRPKAQWSQVFGQSHNSSYQLYHIGEVASPDVRSFAMYGKSDELMKAGDEDSKVYDQFTAPAIGTGTGKTENMVFVDGAHRMVSLMCRLIPSPDWFVGVDSIDLCVDSSWVDQITLDLEPLDAGASMGFTFTAPRWQPDLPDPVTKHYPRQPNHPAAGFYYPDLKELPAIAKVEFIKMKSYTTKELNELARKEIASILKGKGNAELPKQNIAFEEADAEEDKETNEDYKEVSLKSNIERLMDLEEEPVGTPTPHLDDVIVITNPPTYESTEKVLDLKNMDDVVLAVAQGKKLGLHKHLPRHFKSRLHHAVNRMKPNDCLVSEWSEWSPCSVTCGAGGSYRYRQVLREKKKNGRKCPSLTDKRQCGNIHPCTQEDYFE